MTSTCESVTPSATALNVISTPSSLSPAANSRNSPRLRWNWQPVWMRAALVDSIKGSSHDPDHAGLSSVLPAQQGDEARLRCQGRLRLGVGDRVVVDLLPDDAGGVDEQAAADVQRDAAA